MFVLVFQSAFRCRLIQRVIASLLFFKNLPLYLPTPPSLRLYIMFSNPFGFGSSLLQDAYGSFSGSPPTVLVFNFKKAPGSRILGLS